ncbi:hypothetical protein NIES4103_01030 [Nostoc sp. NIES-4103]|nr:hypothetical protein NIES4103_01030 [Nostoc sp. NIES-4103]
MESVVLETRWSARKQATLIGVCVVGIMLTLDVTIVGVALDTIGKSLQASFAQLQWVVNAYSLTLGSFLLTAGSLADIFGRRRMFAFGVGLFSICSLLCGFSQDSVILDTFRALQGLSGALILSSGPAVLANEFHNKERATAFSILGSAVGLGFALGPLVGGILSSGLGWRWIFFVNVPIGLSVLVWAVPKIRETSDPSASHIDWAGLSTFTLSLLLFNFALISGPEKGWNSFWIIGALIGSSVLLIVFIIAEQLQRRPMFDLTLFRHPTFVAVSLMTLTVSFGIVSLLYYIPLYFQSVSNYSPFQAGLTMIPFTLPMLITPLFISQLIKFQSTRLLLCIGLILIGFGTFWMRGGIGTDNSWILLSGLILAGIGAGLCNGLMDNVAVSAASLERSGVASGMYNTTRLSGDAIAIAGTGAILIGNTQTQFLKLISGTSVDILEQSHNIVSQIIQGNISGAAAKAPISAHDLFIHAATLSYTDALHTVLLVVACICFTIALLTFLLMRIGNSANLLTSKSISR